jgi:hypothetical protein
MARSSGHALPAAVIRGPGKHLADRSGGSKQPAAPAPRIPRSRTHAVDPGHRPDAGKAAHRGRRTREHDLRAIPGLIHTTINTYF